MLSPLALLWLLPIGGIITLLYLLKQKRQERKVSSLLLWEQVIKETAAATPFQKLRFDPLLLLQLLAVLLFCIALARPFLWGDSLSGKTVAIVLDASASMNATDVSGGRFAAAVAEARTLIQRKAPTDSVAIVLAGTRAETLAPLTSDKGKLLAALNKAKPTNAVAGPREALLLAASLVASRRSAGVTLITDGAFPRQDDLSLGGAAWSTILVGKESANVGITAFDVREMENDATRQSLEAFVTVHNADTKSRTVSLELRAGEKLIEAREVALVADESRSLTVPLTSDSLPQKADLLTARIESNDDLAQDNEAYAALPSRADVHVLLVSNDDDPFLERALALIPRVQITKASPALFTADAVKSQDLTIWDADAAPPSDLPIGRYLFWGAVPTGSVSPVQPAAGASLVAPVVLDFDRASPLLRFTDLSGVRIREAARITPGPWASVVAEGKEGPLLVAGEHAGSRVVYVAFRPTRSDLPLRVAFPVLVANAVSYLSDRGDTGVTAVLRPGASATLPNGATTVTRPDGKAESVTGGVYTGTDPLGIYTVSGKTGESTHFGVALLSATETDITPVSNPPLVITDAPGSNGDAPKAPRSPHEWWPYLAAPLLLLLMVEWFVFHRGRRS